MHTKEAILYKQTLARHFDKAAPTYDQYGVFQQRVLSELLEYLSGRSWPRILDLGCGTGNALISLNAHTDRLIALDLAPSMLSTARKKSAIGDFICADAEALPLKSGCLDLVFSSLAIQWCLSPSTLFSEIHRVLNCQGEWIFSTLCFGSLAQLSETWQKVDDRQHVHAYPSLECLNDNLVATGFCVEHIDQQTFTLWFEDISALVDSLKKVGASFVTTKSENRQISPATWRRFVTQYEQLRTENGLPLSYQVAFIKAHRQSN